MDRAQADQVLKDVELVPVLEGNVAQAKDFERQLLEHDIPVTLAKPEAKDCCSGGGCGCGKKLQLLVREEDVPRIAELLNRDWVEAVRREGTMEGRAPIALEANEAGELPCPACGHVGPYVEGACGDCGLVLE